MEKIEKSSKKISNIAKALFFAALVYAASILPTFFKTYISQAPIPSAYADTPHQGDTAGGNDGYGDSSCDGRPDNTPGCGPAYP